MKKYLQDFIHQETSGGIVLVLAAALALILANSPLAGLYQEILNAPLTVGLTFRNVLYGINENITHWINDALMCIFFLFIGLEIKEQLLRGELSTRSKALQPVFAVIFGMSTPIAIYFLINRDNPSALHGWAIPSATDTAFALGVLALVGKRVPPIFKILLTAIAVLDDLTAILIIAFFYSKTIFWAYLLLSVVGVVALVVFNRMKVQSLHWYLLSGLMIWLGFFYAGIHPTLAGVVTALFIPLQGKKKNSPSPLKKLEGELHPLVHFAILPLFTLANAGLSFKGLSISHMFQPLALSITMGLTLGKPLGIMTGLFIGHITGLARKASDVKWNGLLGMSILCGMGFTIPLFISDVAFDDINAINQIKLGVLSACLLSAGIGWSICRFVFKNPAHKE